MIEDMNKCASLASSENLKNGIELYEKLTKENKDPLQVMLDMQKKLQDNIAELMPENGNIAPDKLETLGQIYDFLRDNKLSLDDEFREVIDALPGCNLDAKSRSGIWKKWKKNHMTLRNKKLSELTPEEYKELKFEIIDAWHFFMNMFIALRLDAKEIFCYYYLKNHENFRRYQNNY